MFLLCFCFAAANSILFDCFSCKQLANRLHFFLHVCRLFATKTIEKRKKHKLFASYLQENYQKVQNQLLQSKNRAMTQQKHSKPSSKNGTFQILSTMQTFCCVSAMFLLCQNICSAVSLCFCYVKTFALQFCFVFALQFCNVKTFALQFCYVFALQFCNVKTFALQFCYVFALQFCYVKTFALQICYVKKMLCRFALQICHVKTFAPQTATCFALHLGWWTHSVGKINAKAAKLR